MSTAIGVVKLWNKIEPCSMCRKDEMLAHTFVNFSKIRICTTCYDSIPEHIPLDQDSQYVLASIKKARK